MRTISKDSKVYLRALLSFRKQFDVVEITRLFVNSDNQVYAGEWIDSKGVINTNCNTAPDYRFTIMVKY